MEIVVICYTNINSLIVQKIERTSKVQSRNPSIPSLIKRQMKLQTRNVAYGSSLTRSINANSLQLKLFNMKDTCVSNLKTFGMSFINHSILLKKEKWILIFQMKFQINLHLSEIYFPKSNLSRQSKNVTIHWCCDDHLSNDK